MPINERQCAESVQMLMTRIVQAKIRNQDPRSFLSMANKYHQAAASACESGLPVLQRIADYRLGHAYARMSLYDGRRAIELEQDVRRRWKNSPVCAIPEDLEFTQAGMLQRSLEHFERAAAHPAPARLRFFAHLYMVGTLQRARNLGLMSAEVVAQRTKDSWNMALDVFTSPEFQQEALRTVGAPDHGRPDLALYTPLDLLRYAFDLDGERLDLRMTELALRDPFLSVEPNKGEWRLLAFPDWMARRIQGDGTRSDDDEKRVQVLFNDYTAASSFLEQIRRAEPDAVTFELHPPRESNPLECFRLPRRVEGTTYTDELARESTSLTDKQAALLAALLEVQHLSGAGLRRRRVLDMVWPDQPHTRRPKDPVNSLQNLENQLRTCVGPMPAVFAVELAAERAGCEGVEPRVKTDAEQAAQQGGRVYKAALPGVDQDEARNSAEERAGFMQVTGRPEDTLRVRSGVKIYGIVHWPTFIAREGLEPLDE